MSKFLIFVSGAALGAATTWYILKEQYKQRQQEDRESMQAALNRLREEENNEKGYSAPKSVEVCEKPELKEFVEKIQKAGYVDYSSLAAEAKKAKEAPVEETSDEVAEMKPYVISPDEFDSREGYDIQSLTYYADGVLTDVNDIPVENVDDIVGEESLKHFGEFEEDSVYVRNERLGVEYEILLDSRTYEQKKHPSRDTEE